MEQDNMEQDNMEQDNVEQDSTHFSMQVIKKHVCCGLRGRGEGTMYLD